MKTLQFLYIIQAVLSFLLMFYTIYQVVIWLFAYAKPIKKKKIIRKEHKFMAVISARNEEKVISDLIESIKNQIYPKNKIDIYVIADNCTDNTAQIARDAGAIVYERFDELKKSKGYALEWFFDIVLKEFPNKYDAFCVFDADNIVAPNFFSKMNDKLCEGEKLAQGYRDIKNAGDNWISANYAIFYWTMNRFYHNSRYKIGLSPLINGTGFMVSMDIIKEENGWHTSTLAEDTEFSIKQIAKGRKIAWVNDAVIYDEQPTTIKQTWNQRLRWGVGNIQCLKACLPNSLSARPVTPAVIDTMMYMMGMPVVLISFITSFIDLLKFYTMPAKQAMLFLTDKLEFGIAFIVVSFLHAILVVLSERKSLKKVWKGIVTYPLFLALSVLVNFAAFFNMNMAWRPIEHVKNVKINEVQGK